MKNLHQSSIPQDVLTETLNKLNEVSNILSPYLLTVSKDERKGLAKMGDKSLAFVTEANQFSKQNPILRPAFSSQEDFDIDVADATGLLPVSALLEKLLNQVDDTALIAGSEALNHALMFYNNTKLAAKNGIAGAQEITNTLGTRFTRRKRKTEATEE